MKLIDVDALTKRLVEFCNKSCPYTAKARNVMCGSCFMGLALEAVEDAPTIEPDLKWIPCKERLPETEEQVLIYACNVHYILAKYKEIRTCDGVYKMAWVTEDAYSIPREIKHKVICWKPLSEPYREEK